jgi:hypothetical protein
LTLLATPGRTVLRRRDEVLLSREHYHGLEVELSRLDWIKLDKPASVKTPHGSRLVALEKLKHEQAWIPLEALPVDTPGMAGLVTRRDETLVSSPYALVYSASIEGPPPSKIIEGRRVRLLNLAKGSDLGKIRPNHAVLAKWWVGHFSRLCQEEY